MRAYCWASGQIELGRRVPDGAIQIMAGPPKKLRDFVEVRSRHAYDGKTLLVPGIPEAPYQRQGLKALRRWLSWCRKGAPTGVEVA